MIFELLHAPLPDGYGEALLPLALCKKHLSVEDSTDDTLIEALRDAAIEFIEGYCAVSLGPKTDMVWKADGFPACNTTALCLGVRPVTEITGVTWFDSAGEAVTGDIADFRLGPWDDLFPAIGGSWPTGLGGGVEITFDAGFAADDAPHQLLAAARMFLGHLWLNREAVVTGTITAEVPMGVASMCARWRRVVI